MAGPSRYLGSQASRDNDKCVRLHQKSPQPEAQTVQSPVLVSETLSRYIPNGGPAGLREL